MRRTAQMVAAAVTIVIGLTAAAQLGSAVGAGAAARMEPLPVPTGPYQQITHWSLTDPACRELPVPLAGRLVLERLMVRASAATSAAPVVTVRARPFASTTGPTLLDLPMRPTATSQIWSSSEAVLLYSHALNDPTHTQGLTICVSGVQSATVTATGRTEPI
jgi:hypothetical protein